jgi:hypothetical protein
MEYDGPMFRRLGLAEDTCILSGKGYDGRGMFWTKSLVHDILDMTRSILKIT